MYTLISKWKNLQGLFRFSSEVLKNDSTFIDFISTSSTKIAREISFISKIYNSHTLSVTNTLFYVFGAI